ncbi:LytR/AlgR family response regulator transcription factor [Anaeromicropila herbilytica]|nr:LytTR family DNA-binding domain-containing protein [Anaeromicropila herbilytica]
MKIVIVDNEKNALNYMVDIIKDYDNISLEKVFLDPIEALVYLLKNPIDALFLDIEMPSINGMYLAEQVLNVYPNTKICFVTAFNDFAVKAFEMNAVDYILKPFQKERIDSALYKMRLQNEIHNSVERLSNEYKYELDIICGFDDEDVVLIPFYDIYYFEVVNRLIYIHTKDKIYRGNKTLCFYEDKLKKRNFFRAHKCYIVNLEKVSKFKPRINYTYDMFLKDSNDVVPLSRGKVKELKEFFDF